MSTNIINKVPKAELHVHVEGTLRPQQAKKIAARNGVTLAPNLFDENGEYQYNDFLDLVTKTYQSVADAMKTRKDYEEVVYDYLCQCADENTLYVELIACPGQCERTGISYKDMIDGIADGIDKARDEFGIEARINVTFERHRPGAEARKDADRILSYQHDYIVGLDIAGGEQPHDMDPFKPLYEEIVEQFKHPLGIRMHAGEGVGPENVVDALSFKPSRIGHGVRSIEDPSVIKALVDNNVTLEVCPTSNIYLMPQYMGDFKNHPMQRLYKKGVKLTLNSDDPGMFGKDCTIGGEYAIAHKEWGFSAQQLGEFTRNALEASYAPASLKKTLLAKADKLMVDALRGNDFKGGNVSPLKP